MTADAALRSPRPHRLRGLWRLLLCLLHALQALAVAAWLFPRLDAAGRQARVRWWGATMLRRLDVRLDLRGDFLAPGNGGCLLVANHVSFLDILAIQSICPWARFVSKADVKSWPLLSKVIDAGGTLYLERERKRDALRVVRQVAEALTGGHIIAVFPEGTTADGTTLLPFHGNLLQAAITTGSWVQAVAVSYSDAAGAPSRAVEFVGATTLLQSVWRIACADRLSVHLRPLPPQRPPGIERREFAARLRAQIGAAIAGNAGDTGHAGNAGDAGESMAASAVFPASPSREPPPFVEPRPASPPPWSANSS